MTLGRREFLRLAAAGAFTGTISPSSLASGINRNGFKAIAFDAFPLFDPRPVAALAETLLPGNGQSLINAWRTRQFDYQWLRALGGQYVDFLEATSDSLIFAANQLQLDLSPAGQKQLMTAWSNLPLWPDAVEAVNTLHRAGLRLAVLSNMTPHMIADGLKRSKLDGMFEAIISTDQIRSYKPDPRAYQMGIDTLGLTKEEILFVAFAGWDAAGAKWFGYPTFWLNRMHAPREELGVEADAVGSGMAALVDFVLPSGRHGKEA